MGRAVSAAAARHLLNGLDALVHQVGDSLLLLLKFGQNVALVAASYIQPCFGCLLLVEGGWCSPAAHATPRILQRLAVQVSWPQSLGRQTMLPAGAAFAVHLELCCQRVPVAIAAGCHRRVSVVFFVTALSLHSLALLLLQGV